MTGKHEIRAPIVVSLLIFRSVRYQDVEFRRIGRPKVFGDIGYSPVRLILGVVMSELQFRTVYSRAGAKQG